MSQAFDFGRLVDLCRQTHEETRRSAARAVDTHLVTRNWLFGWYIVEYEQRGADRSELYGKKLIERLSGKLGSSGLKGCSPTNLRKFRELYRAYPEIQQTPSVTSPSPASGGHASVIGQTPSDRSTPPASDARTSPIGPTPSDRFASPEPARRRPRSARRKQQWRNT